MKQIRSSLILLVALTLLTVPSHSQRPQNVEQRVNALLAQMTLEEKLGQPKEVHAPQAGWVPGLPDEGGSPDRTHYWAVYNRFGITIVYNSPIASDKNASIHAILVNE